MLAGIRSLAGDLFQAILLSITPNIFFKKKTILFCVQISLGFTMLHEGPMVPIVLTEEIS